jgi:hypothetical protein
MSDESLINAIGLIRQRWESIQAKKRKSQVKKGLESKLGTLEPFTEQEQRLLDRITKGETNGRTGY